MKSLTKAFTMIELISVIVIIFIISVLIGSIGNIDIKNCNKNKIVQKAPKQINKDKTTGWN